MKLLSSYLAPNILSRRHGGQPSSEWARFLHSHSFRLMTFFFICCPRMLKITCFWQAWDEIPYDWIKSIMKLSQLVGESILNCRDGQEQGRAEGEEPLVWASYLEQGHASQSARALPCGWGSWLCLAVFHALYQVGSAFILPVAQTKGLKDNEQETFHL